MRALLVFMIMTVSLMADETPTAPPPVSVTTNYVKAHKSFRRVDGQLYNIEKSVQWREIVGTCTTVLTNGIILRTIVEKRARFVTPAPDAGTSISNILSGSRPVGPSEQMRTWQEEGPTIELVNYDGSEPTIGRTIRVRAMKVGTATRDGEVMEKWDCGSPNIVPVIITNPPAWQLRTNRAFSKPPVAK